MLARLASGDVWPLEASNLCVLVCLSLSLSVALSRSLSLTANAYAGYANL